MKFDVECRKCGCQFISEEINPFKYCSNCRRWLTIDDVKKIEERGRVHVHPTTEK